MSFYQLSKYDIIVQQIRTLSSDFREFSKFADMQILILKTPFSANFRTLMRTVWHTECRYWGPPPPSIF